ncbi:MAG: hypothetical protein UX04_C0001G0168 [Microgenomates group bacterium GW2011_GWF2_45_18]|nr:MAG: hypothetical protein UX04_C0001G0168 [Microgenomates group bacterium GW2011_GWF2_45_18]OGJ41724.1 MAG: hypothetical protein A2378_02510 [Candidatus Pacebacteria bacterium RIFOXYB1_FULL_44_10]HAU99136.1 hypothetical protein [Candidatus Paceibacterota bacterium]HAX01666.1 hypothetical protein [Candidatus Paceibacterota bacterium]
MVAFFRTYPFFVIFSLFVLVFCAHYVITGQAVYGDGIGYYAHLRAGIIRRSFDTTPEYKHTYTPENNNARVPMVAPTVQIVPVSNAGQALNFYSVVPALMWSSGYFFVHAVVLGIQWLGGNISSSGFGDPYQLATGISSILYVVLGLRFFEAILVELGDRRFARITTLAFAFSTPLLYYGAYDVIHSHTSSFFLVHMFIYIVIRSRKSALHKSEAPRITHVILGLLLGVLIANRPQDGAVGMLYVWFLNHRSHTFSFIFALCAGLLVWIVPNLYLYPDLSTHPYIESLSITKVFQASTWIAPLFHAYRGLFVISPILVFSLLGFFCRRCGQQKYVVPFFLFFLAEYAIISIHGGWQAAAYGGRMFISSLLFFAFGWQQLSVSIQQKSIVYILTILFCIGNVLSIGNFLIFEKGAEGGRVGIEQRTMQRFNQLKLFWQKQN